MSAAPLLDRVGDEAPELAPNIKAKTQVPKSPVSVFLEAWWEASTDAVYLSSWISRRSSWWFMFPLAILCVGVTHIGFWISGELSTVVILLDVGLAALTMRVTRLPLESLRSDFKILTLIQIWVAAFLLLEPTLVVRSPSGYAMLPVFLFLVSALGLHGSVVMISGCICIVTYFAVDFIKAAGSGFWAIQSVALGAGAMAIIIAFEFLLAWSFRKYQEQLQATNLLVQHGCHGFLRLSVPSGVVTTANHGLTELLGPDILGRPLADFAKPEDRGVVTAVYEDVEKYLGLSVRAVFTKKATRFSPGTEFDAKLVPYQFSDGDLRLICQVIGEIRDLEPSREAAREAAGRAFAEQVWDTAAKSAEGDSASTAATNAAVVVIDPKTGRTERLNLLSMA